MNADELDWSGYDEMEPPGEFEYRREEHETRENLRNFSRNQRSGTLSGTRGTPEHKTAGQTPGTLMGNPEEPGSGTFGPPLIGGRRFPAAEYGYRFMDSESFLFSVEEAVPLWGDVDTPLWQSGESLMLVGPPGVGKSTLAHHLLVALLTGGQVLGYPVSEIDGDILYLAMDRPKQIARAFRRVVTSPDLRQLIHERVIFHAGPLPKNLVADPTVIAKICTHYGVKVVVVDSIKDAITSPSDELQANSYNIARQKCLADGVEWIELHHNRKSNGENREPRTLDDVYGNRFITAGAGSVFSLWGQSGDTVISLTHIRQPGNGLPPMKLGLDKESGALEPMDVVTLEILIRQPVGVTAKEAAVAVYGPSATESDVRNVRKKLKKMVVDQKAYEDRTEDEIRFRFTSGLVSRFGTTHTQGTQEVRMTERAGVLPNLENGAVQ